MVNTAKLSSSFHNTTCIQMTVLAKQEAALPQATPHIMAQDVCLGAKEKISKCSLLYNVHMKQLHGSWIQVNRGLCV